MKKPISILIIVIAVLSSCVPARKYEEMQVRAEKAEKDRLDLLEKNKDLEAQLNELEIELDNLKMDVKSLRHDTTVTGVSLRKMTKQYDKINRLNDELVDKIRQLQQSNAVESTKLVSELEDTRSELQKKEDALRTLEGQLTNKEQKLNNLNTELQEREKRVKELEAMIAEQELASNELRRKIADALLGFEDKGLTVQQKDGKIYVSMEAKLLFPSGSTTIDSEGKRALEDLAGVLKDQDDISILVEGHTDTDKIKGGSMKDNWDLSVLRATAVIRILVDKGVEPTRVTPAGRGEFVPVDTGKSQEAKAKNRRIEIIITPNLDKIFDIIDSSK